MPAALAALSEVGTLSPDWTTDLFCEKSPIGPLMAPVSVSSTPPKQRYPNTTSCPNVLASLSSVPLDNSLTLLSGHTMCDIAGTSDLFGRGCGFQQGRVGAAGPNTKDRVP